MPLRNINSVPTSFLIDLSTIDKKVDKLRKYFINCDIDLKNHPLEAGKIGGLNFINPNLTYKTLREDLAYRKYKEDLANLVYETYTKRSADISVNLQNLKIASKEDITSFLNTQFSLPRDEFGSQFDRAAAVNTDPNNLVSQFFNIKPYKYLKVDILSREEFDIYTGSINSVLDAEKTSFLLKEISSIASYYYPQNSTFSGEPSEYIVKIKEKLDEYSYVSQNFNNYQNIISSDISQLKTNNLFLNAIKQIDPDLYFIVSKQSNESNNINPDILKRAKIGVIDFYLKNELKNSTENSQAKSFEVDSFVSKYEAYDFYENKFIGPDYSASPNEIYFKLSFYRELPKKINNQKKKVLSDTVIEYETKTRVSIGSPLSNSEQTNNRFVALLSPRDFIGKKTGKFFEPTILAILSDIDYIDSHIKEVDWAFCPTPDYSNPQSKFSADKWEQQNAIQGAKATSAAYGLVRSIPYQDDVAAGQIKELVESDSAFSYYTFPDLYFIPNLGQGPIGFFKEFNHDISTISAAIEILKDKTKFYYEDGFDTPTAQIYRDESARKFFENTLRQNGFSGLIPASYNIFSDPLGFQQFIDKMHAFGDKSVQPLTQFMSAKVNIACLLSEFRECFFPKTTSCKNVLRSFRFSELENIVRRVFPDTAYPGIFDAIERVKSQQIKEEAERTLVEEIKVLEENLKDNRRRFVIFQQLDMRVEPGFALSEADRRMGVIGADLSVEQQLQKKLKEYKDLKTSQELFKSEEEKQNENLKAIDDFLDMLENEYGINTDLLCNITDLFNFSYSFFDFPWPQFPSFDFFYDLKLTFDLSIIKLILDFFISLIIKLLGFLVDCDAWKDLIGASATEISALSMGVESKSVITQLKNGSFDFDQFIDNNPAIDPEKYYSEFYDNIIKNNISGAISLTQESSLTASLGGIPLFSNMSNPEGDFASITAKNKTITLLQNKKDDTQYQKTNQEIRIKLGGLIRELSSKMEPTSFIKLFTGKMSESEETYVVNYINNQNDQLLSYLFSEQTGKNIEQTGKNIINFFKNLGSISGMNQVEAQLQAAAKTYTAKSIRRTANRTNAFCDDVSYGGDTPLRDPPPIPTLPEIPSADDAAYAGIIRDLYNTTPERIKEELEEKLFKPMLIGNFPNGGIIPVVDASNKRLLKNTFKPSTEKFKNSVNNFYNNLTLAKKYNKKVYKYLQQDGKQVDNPEYQDLIKNGGGKDGQPEENVVKTDENGNDYIEQPSTKYIACGVFTENFDKLNETIQLTNSGEEFTISVNGSYKYTSDTIQSFYDSQGFVKTNWKISSTQDNTTNLYKIFEKKPNDSYEEVFSFNAISGTRENFEDFTSYKAFYSQILKDSITRATEDLNLSENFDLNLFVGEGYEDFLKSNLELIIEKINSDNLLKEMPEIPADDLLVQIKESLTSVMPSFSEQTQSQKLGIQPPLTDVAMKYINFHPRATDAQKKKNIEPNLLGISEITKMILNIMSKRDSDIISLKTIDEMLSDSDNTLLLSAIDGLILGLVRTLCTEISMRSLFVLKTFKFKNKLLEDLLIPTYAGEELYKIILKYSSTLNNKRNAFKSLMSEHIDYLHDFIFQQKISQNEDDYLFSEIKSLKKMNDSMEIDKEILIRYKNRVGITTEEITEEYEQKINTTIECLREEIKNNKIKIEKLQLRNLSFNELTTIFDKLSYITSTNQKVVEGLGENCQTENINSDVEFLNEFVLDNLFEQKLYTVLNDYSLFFTNKDLYLKLQSEKFAKPFSFILEKYIYVPELKDEYYSTQLGIKLRESSIRGPVQLDNFLRVIGTLPRGLIQQNQINKYFKSNLKYGIRLCFINNNSPDPSSIIDFNNELSFEQNIQELKRLNKHKIYISNTALQVKTVDESELLISEYEKSYCIPYYIPETPNTDPDRIQQPSKLGIINVFPIISHEITITNEMFDRSYDEQNLLFSQLDLEIKQKFLCDPKFSFINAIYAQRNLLSNMLILSNIYTLGSAQIKEQFNDTKYSLLQAIKIKIDSLNTVSDFFEIFDYVELDQKMLIENAGLVTKMALRAAVQVLSYYCYTTDPNISTAMLVRQAIQLTLSISSQIGNAYGNDSIPTQLPYPLNTLGPYAIGQLPVNIFGFPPAGFGVGPPITMPGLILLGLEFILLSTDYYAQLGSDSDNLIKQQIKQLCFDLEGYKKYGIE